MTAAAAVARGGNWREALVDLVRRMPLLADRHTRIDLALLFASSAYAREFPRLLAGTRTAAGAGLLVGCSGQGVIGPGEELEGVPALALLALSVPDATLRAVHVTQDELERLHSPHIWHRYTGVEPGSVRAWLIFADPFSMDGEALITSLAEAYPGVPLSGGLASAGTRRRRTHVFLDERAYDHGAVLLALGGPYGVKTVVSQGAAPIGQPWTITGAQGHVVETIGRRPAYRVLIDTLQAVPPQARPRAQRNLLVGLAMDEHREEYHRGDFLIRNLVGVIPESGALAVGASPRVGQTLQFQVRDPTTASQDLHALLAQARADLGGREPVAALLCSCNGRGAGMFGRPHHDAQAVRQQLGPVPLAGLFCNGEIGPVGARPFLHGFTASLVLLVPDA